MRKSSATESPYPSREELEAVIGLVIREASTYLQGLDGRPARSQTIREALGALERSKL